MDDMSHDRTSKPRGRVRLAVAVSLTVGLVAGVAGCTQTGQDDAAEGLPDETTEQVHVSAEQRADMEQLMSELTDASRVAVELAGLRSIQSSSSWAIVDMPVDGPGQGSMQASQLPSGQEFAVFGVCAGAAGTAQVIVEGNAPISLECTPGDAGYSVQRLVEKDVLEDFSLSAKIGGVPAGAAWAVEFAAID